MRTVLPGFLIVLALVCVVPAYQNHAAVSRHQDVIDGAFQDIRAAVPVQFELTKDSSSLRQFLQSDYVAVLAATDSNAHQRLVSGVDVMAEAESYISKSESTRLVYGLAAGLLLALGVSLLVRGRRPRVSGSAVEATA